MQLFLDQPVYLDFTSFFVRCPDNSIIAVVQVETFHEVFDHTFHTHSANFDCAVKVDFKELIFFCPIKTQRMNY